LLGAILMEDMDLLVETAVREISVNPQNPNIAVSVVKRLELQFTFST